MICARHRRACLAIQPAAGPTWSCAYSEKGRWYPCIFPAWLVRPSTYIEPGIVCALASCVRTVGAVLIDMEFLLGAGALAFGAAKVVQEQKRLRNREEIVELVRDFFSSQGTISCLYVKLYESTDDRLVGGLVLEDDRHFAFVYENGQLSYEEEA